MRVKIIGGHGGVTKTSLATSYLINDELLIDAGSVAHGLELSAQEKIEYILISHAHLDHIKDLAFLCDNFFGRKKPFEVYLHQTTHQAIKNHLFNDIIWPDFSVLPSREKPTIRFNEVRVEQSFFLGEYKVTAVHVNHPGNAIGFIIEHKDKTLIFTQDTASTERIWQIAKDINNLKGIFTEVSFPNSMQEVANVSFHHTPNTLKEELLKIKHKVPIYIGHLKPTNQQELIQEIEMIKDSRLHIMEEDDLILNF